MAIENFSADTQSFERGSNLYAQVSTDLKGGLEVMKQNAGTVNEYLPNVQFDDGAVHFVSSPGDARRKAAEQSPTKQQEAQKRPADEEPPKHQPNREVFGGPARKVDSNQTTTKPADEARPARQPNREALQAPSRKEDTNQAKPNGNEGPTRQGDPSALKAQPNVNERPTRPGNGTEAPTRKEEPGRKEQQGSKGPEQKEPTKQEKDCGKDYSAAGDKVMAKPTNWKPDTELKTKQGQEWNKHAQEQRDKPLKTDANGNYDVKYGDSLWGIAERSVKERTGKQPSPSATFEEMRRIVGMNADKLGSQSNWQMIKPGMQLRIKGDNPCEVPGKVADGSKDTPRVLGENPKDKPKVAVEERPRVAMDTTGRKPEQKSDQNGAPGNRVEQRPSGQKVEQQNRKQDGDSP